MLRFRGFREAERPEPLDLIVVSTFRGMAGMDVSNRTLRERADCCESLVKRSMSRAPRTAVPSRRSIRARRRSKCQQCLRGAVLVMTEIQQ